MKDNIEWDVIVAWICVLLMVFAVANCTVKIRESNERVQIEKIKQNSLQN